MVVANIPDTRLQETVKLSFLVLFNLFRIIVPEVRGYTLINVYIYISSYRKKNR